MKSQSTAVSLKQDAEIKTLRPTLRLVVAPEFDMASCLKMVADKQRDERAVMSITCDLMAHL